MYKQLYSAILRSLLVVSPLLSAAAIAADDASENTLFLEEVVVTSTFRETNLMDTSQSISSMDGDFIKDMNAEDMSDLFLYVPGLNMTQAAAGNSRFVVRGITSQTGESPLSVTASAVGVYMDNVPVTSGVGPSVQMSSTVFDIARVEVLKGPQGTLFGEGSQGGTIRYIFNKPNVEEFGAAINSGYTQFDESGDTGHKIDAMVNIPLSDQFAVRLSMFDTSQAGWIDNIDPADKDFNIAETRGGRFSFLYDFSDTISFEGSYYTSEQKSEGVSRSINGTPYENLSNRNPEASPMSTDEFDVLNLTANVDLGFANMTVSGSRTERDMFFFHEYSFGLTSVIDLVFGGFFPGGTGTLTSQGWPNTFETGPTLRSILNRNRVITERDVFEMRFVSPEDQRLRWTAGLFYKDSIDLYDFYLRTDTYPGKEAFQPILDGLFDSDDPDDTSGATDLTEMAVFAEFSYDISEEWSVTAGGRFSDQKQELSDPDTMGAEDTKFAPKLVVSWAPNDDVLAYASYALGFRQGNTNFTLTGLVQNDIDNRFERNPSDPIAVATQVIVDANETFDGDELHNYELGVKTTLWEGRAELAASAYYIKWQDLIQEFVDPALASYGPNGSYSLNQGDAEITGFEMELNVLLMEGLHLRVGGDINDSEIDSGSNKGKELVFAPDKSFTAGIDYTMVIGSDYELNSHVDFAYVGEQFANGVNALVIPSYETKNLRFTLRSLSPDSGWRASIFINNVENEANLVNIAALQGDYFYSKPRVIGLDISWEL